ncbi:tetratricopeptide repeat protein [Hyphococcus lacteus]|uniref:Tetratricopeptide repeat protein n=1 Tax=Hyphococcus lacteus TaxID=3143536 RepID=A0ABV3Z717_9PROT
MRLKNILLVSTLFGLVGACATTPQNDSRVGDYLSGRLAARSNAIDAAATAFEGARSETGTSDEVVRSAFFYQIAAGDIEAAAGFAEKILENDDPEDDDLAELALAARDLKAGNFTGAREALKSGAEIDYFRPVMTIIDAWALAGQEGPEPALRALASNDEDTFRGFHPLHQAFLFERAGLNDEARTAYQLALMTYGGAVGRDAYGSFLERTGDVDAAREHYELLSQYRGPDRQIAMHGLARLDAGKMDRVWTSVPPEKGAAVALYSFGATILQQSFDQRSAAQKAGFRVGDANYDMPLAFVQIALYLAPDFDHAQRLAGSILNSYGDNQSAISMLRGIPSTSAFYEQAQIEIAGGLIGLDQRDEALSVLRKAARADGAIEAQFSYGNLLAGEERHQDAVAAYTKLIDGLSAEPTEDAWRFFVARAASYMALDNWPDAEADLERAVVIAPNEATALNYLGYSWAERGENLEEAFALIEKAVSLEPNSGAFIDSLGWAHYQQGDYEDAVGHLEHAASLEPSDPTVTDHLGDVYWMLGRKIEARYQWKHVLELEPDDKLRNSIEEKLKKGLPDSAE